MNVLKQKSASWCKLINKLWSTKGDCSSLCSAGPWLNHFICFVIKRSLFLFLTKCTISSHQTPLKRTPASYCIYFEEMEAGGCNLWCQGLQNIQIPDTSKLTSISEGSQWLKIIICFCFWFPPLWSLDCRSGTLEIFVTSPKVIDYIISISESNRLHQHF